MLVHPNLNGRIALESAVKSQQVRLLHEVQFIIVKLISLRHGFVTIRTRMWQAVEIFAANDLMNQMLIEHLNLRRGKQNRLTKRALLPRSLRTRRFEETAGLSPGPIGTEMLCYMLCHEAHHRGQVCMLAHQLGFPLPSKVANGIWNWEKLL
jgi:hypothetical protein